MSDIQLGIGKDVIRCELLREVAPRTCHAIEQLLPFEGDLHYAKIAGEEIFFGIPLILPLEQGTDAGGLAPGSVAYWPGRQVFCIFYGPPQEEAVDVTVFARVLEDLEVVRRIGEQVRARQGQRILVELVPPIARGEDGPTPKTSSELREARRAIWRRMPAEVEGLAQRRGLMQPAGVTLYAEADTRVVAELLHAFSDALDRGELNDEGAKSALTCMLEPFANHLLGMYGLPEAAAVVRSAQTSLAGLESDELQSTLRELALYTSRLNLWLDLLIPWNDLNELMRARPP